LALSVRLAVGAAGAPAGRIEAAVEGRLAEVRRGPTGFSAELDGVRRVGPGPALPARVLLRGPPTPPGLPAFESLAAGERARARVRLRAPEGPSNPGRSDRARRLLRHGIGAVGGLVHPALHVRLAQPGVAPPGLRLARARVAAASRLRAAGEGGALLASLALGRRDGLDPATRNALARLGLAHLLAVSGLHLALVGGGTFALLRRVFARYPRLAARVDPRRLALVCALPAAVAYAALTGWGIPVRRALICLLALTLTFLRRRPGPRLHPLAAAALLVLALDPAALFEAGAQMSFAASAALLMARPIASRDASGGAAARQLLATTAVAVAATSPFAAHHFGAAPLAGLVANLFAVPWTAAVLLPSALVAAAVALFAPEAHGAAALIGLASLPAGWSLAAARTAARLLPTPAPLPSLPLLASGLALVAAILALRCRSLALRVVVVVASSIAIGALPPPAIEPRPPRVVLLDVGQGDATLIQSRDGAVLVDGGTALPGGVDSGRAVVLPALAALGVRRLDLVVASHADLDHRGGLPSVLEALPVAQLWIPAGARDEPGFAALLAVAARRGVAVRERGAGDAAWARNDLVVQPLWPPREGAVSTRDRSNDRSLVLHVALAGVRVLLPGDLEAAGEGALLASGADLAAELLKLPHHGSRTSSSPEFLAAVGARWAVASAPRAGRFGMPHAEVLARLEADGVGLAWTGRDGAVLVGLAPGLRVRSWRLGVLRPP
jgi:competence protein ComEC